MLNMEKVDPCFQKPLLSLVKTITSILEVVPSSESNQDIFTDNFFQFCYWRIHSKPGGCRQGLHCDHCPHEDGNY